MLAVVATSLELLELHVLGRREVLRKTRLTKM
jgi:hypothetical protein